MRLKDGIQFFEGYTVHIPNIKSLKVYNKVADYTYYNASGPVQVNPFIFQQTYMLKQISDFKLLDNEKNEWIILAAYYLNPSNGGGSSYTSITSHGVKVAIQNKSSGRIRDCFLVVLEAIIPGSNVASQNNN